MKTLAIFLVMLGVGIAAAFGARNVDAVRDRQNIAGRAKLLGSVDAALEAELNAPDTTAERRAAAATERAALADKLATAKAQAAAIPAEAVPATDRLSGWFEHNGLPFAAGVVLIVLGGVLARRDDKRKAAAMTPGNGSGATGPGEAIDFGVKLKATAATVQRLHTLMADVQQRSAAGLEPLKSQLEVIQREDIEPLIDTKQQVINRFGMAGFAAVFGPLSGAERYLNRAWVAMVDRHWDEAQESLRIAVLRFDETLAELARQTGAAPFTNG